MILHNMTQNDIVVCMKEELTSETKDITLGGNSYIIINNNYSCVNYDTLYAERKVELIEEDTPVIEDQTSSINGLVDKIYEIIQGSTLRGDPGVSIVDSYVDDDKNLILKLSDDTTINVGQVFDQDYLTEESDPSVPLWAKAPTKPTYTSSEISDLIDTINNRISDGVPSWSRSSTKPTYDASEIVDLDSHIKSEVFGNTIYNDSGAIVQYDNFCPNSTLEYQAYVTSSQNGTGDASTTNIREIVGADTIGMVRCGKNLLPVLGRGILDVVNTNVSSTYINGRYTITSRIGVGSFAQIYCSRFKITHLAGKTCVLHADEISCSNAANGPRVFINYYNAEGENIGNANISPTTLTRVLQIPDNAVKSSILILIDYNKQQSIGDVLTVSGLMLELGNVASQFEEFIGNTYSIQLSTITDSQGNNIGMQYGGYVDSTLNKYVQTHTIKEFDGTESWSGGALEGIYKWKVSLPDMKTNTTDIICSHALMSSSCAPDHCYADVKFNYCTELTLEDFKSFLAAQYTAGTPVSIIYELATPIEYNIGGMPNPLALYGVNTIFCNTGSMNVTGPTKYNYDSRITNTNSDINTLRILTNESNFKSSATLAAFNNEFDYLCIESLEDTGDIDLDSADGQTVITNYYNSVNHTIEKTSSDTLTILSRTFTLPTIPYNAWILLDYEGPGTITSYLSKNNGTSWVEMTEDSVGSIGVSLTKNVKVKLVLSGKLVLKNIAWGCK